MIFYRINAPHPFLVATQAEAKSAARQGSWKWEQVDIPTDKAGLMAFVNELLDGRDDPLGDGSDYGVTPLTDIPRSENPARQSQESFTASEIEDFVLNRATVAQVENIFATLGTRFAEKRVAA